MTEVDDNVHIDASALVTQTDRFSAVHMNHSRVRPNVLREKDQSTMRVSFYAARDIPANEELIYDYGDKFWSGREDQELA